MVIEPRYAKNSESTEAWQPRSISQFSINNRSGSTYDIISHTPHKYQGFKQISLLDSQVANRKKGVVEFEDLRALHSINVNKGHQ